MRGVEIGQEQCLTQSKHSKNVSLTVIIIICFRLYGHALLTQDHPASSVLHCSLIASLHQDGRLQKGNAWVMLFKNIHQCACKELGTDKIGVN